MAGSEQASELDQELIASLERFDGMLASEQQTAAQARVEAEAAAEAAAGSSVGSGGFGDDDSGFGDPVGGAQTGEEPAAASRGSESGQGNADESSGEETETTPGSSAGDGSGGGSRVPPDIPDGSDDDIVARQLREAAMNEEDPELREKLWDEYREYKAAAKKKSG
jgi:hypothetical protein